jgi:hypothetical protein
MSISMPWDDSRPVWEVMKGEAAIAAREDFEERAAIMEYCNGQSRGTAELCAYAFLVERLVEDPALPFAAVTECNIGVQLDRAKRFRKHEDVYRGRGL